MVDHDSFVEWAESRFDSVIVKGNEVRINSIFTDDYKHKLWCNPRGGKFERYGGVYHCWKTDEKGTLISLVMKVDQCSYEEAQKILKVSTSITLAELETKLKEFYVAKKKKNTIELPPYTYLITSLNNHFSRRAIEFLEKRKLPYDNLYVCVEGEYSNRIIIPWYEDGKLVCYNSRHLGKGKYLSAQNKGDHLYFPQPPENGRIYLTEGEFDAIALSLCGLNSVASGGKNVTETQVEKLKRFQVTISFDNDERGKEGTQKLIKQMLEVGARDLKVIRPESTSKDWNEMWIKHDKEAILEYIQRERKVDSFTLTL